MEIKVRAHSLTNLEDLIKDAIEALKKKLENQDKNVEMITHENGDAFMIDPIG